MKKIRKIPEIEIYHWLKESDGTFEIHIRYIGLRPETMKKCIDITKHFAKGNEFFFGFYRTDGMNLTPEEWDRYGIEIPEYFQANGRYEPLVRTVKKRRKVKTYGGYKLACSAPINDSIYEMLPKIFHYNLETMYFCPKIDWRTFVQALWESGTWDKRFVGEGLTDLYFSYGESGDFSISFDPNVYDVESMKETINHILAI